MKRNWNLGDFFAEQTGFDNHLGGELHPVVYRSPKPFPDEKRKKGFPIPVC
jgi:hypothetical protein